MIAATAASAVAVVFFFRGDEELSERPFPAYWSELDGVLFHKAAI